MHDSALVKISTAENHVISHPTMGLQI